jgi:ribonuclease D
MYSLTFQNPIQFCEALPSSRIMHYPIVDVITREALIKLAEELIHKPRISFDTEYDSFKRYYGFTLHLLQVFDGETVYLIDPLLIGELNPIFSVFENESCQKVLYSGSEDLALMLALGCQTKNIFDVQIAATISNHPARNLAALMEAETGQPINKSQQQSDWSKRPLTDAQREYVANDVIHLLDVADTLTSRIQAMGLMHVLEEENKALEEIVLRDHRPKLKSYHYKLHSDEFCRVLLAMLEWRDSVGKQLNLPPARIIDAEQLENILHQQQKQSTRILWDSFHYKVIRSEEYRKQLLDILDSYDRHNTLNTYERKPRISAAYTDEEKELILQQQYQPVRDELIQQYGDITGEYLTRGLKKIITKSEMTDKPLKAYQKAILRDMESRK